MCDIRVERLRVCFYHPLQLERLIDDRVDGVVYRRRYRGGHIEDFRAAHHHWETLLSLVIIIGQPKALKEKESQVFLF